MLLGRDRLKGILETPQTPDERSRHTIFRADSWDPDQLRGASYDLRIAGDVLVPPPGARLGEGGAFIMGPGDVAYVASVERFCMPWDVQALITVKFRGIRDGLLVLHGGVVDPGYGLERNDDGKWVPKPDERLYLQIANVGAEPIVIQPGMQTLIRLQFFEIPEVPDKKGIDTTEIRREYDPRAERPDSLAFFTHAQKTRADMETLTTRMSGMVMLGIFVLGIAAIGAVAGVLTAMLSAERARSVVEAVQWDGVGILTVVLGALVAGAFVWERRDAERLALERRKPMPLHLIERRAIRRDLRKAKAELDKARQELDRARKEYEDAAAEVRCGP